MDEDLNFTITPSELSIVLKAFYIAREPLMIVGAPGIGKTEISEQVTTDLGYDQLYMFPAISEPVDFRGMPVYRKETGTAEFVPFGTLNDLVNCDRPTVVLVDDFGQANISVQSATMHLFRARQIGDHKISDHVRFVLCTNDKTHHAGVSGAIEPVKGRMTSIYHLVTDPDDWIYWAINHGIRPEVIGYIRMCNDMLSDFQPNMGFENSPSPRGNEAVSKILNMNLPRKIETKSIKGATGAGYAVGFEGFRRIYDQIDDPRRILTDPMSVSIPSANSLDVMWAYCSALSYLAKPKHMDNIVKFAERLPRELQIKLLEYDCKAADPANHETAAFNNWFIKNQGVYKAA